MLESEAYKTYLAYATFALTKAEQIKLATKRSLIETHSSHTSGSGADKGTGSKPGVPDASAYGSDDEQISWKSSDEEDDDEVGLNDNDDDNDDDENNNDDDDDADNQYEDDQEDDEDQDDVNEQTDSDNDGANVEEEELDEEETNDEDEANELYRDVNVNLEGRDIEMTDAQQTNVQTTQVIEDTYVIITSVNPECQQQSSSVSSGFISNMLNPSPDTCIDSIFNLNTESTSLIDVLVTTIAEPPLLSTTTLPPPPTHLIIHLQQTPVPTPATQTNQFAVAVSSIPGIVDAYLANKMHEAVKTAVQLQSNRLRDEAQAKNEDFLNKLDDNIKKIIKDQVKEQVKAQVSKILLKIEKTVNEQLEAEVLTRSSNESKTSHAVAANLSELELKKILIDKIESNKLIHISDEQKNLYKALVDAYESDKLILDTYGDNVTFKRRRDDEDKDEEPSAGSNRGPREEEQEKNQSQLKLAKPPTLDRDWNKTFPDAHEPVQPWLSSLAQMEDPRESFNELIDTPLDFSAFVMNRLKVDTLTPELLAGLTFELMKGSCKSLVELEYFFEEVYKATTDQLDWNNPEVYLSGGVSSRTYTTSVTKTKAADYGNIKWIEDLVPNTMWSQVPVSYDKHALWGISHWGRKRQQFYGFAANRESARDVYSKRRIIAVTKLQIVEWHNYKHLDWITVRRDDDKLYTFKEGDFNRLRIQDIEDMLLLLVQGKLTNLTVEERLAFNVSLRMFTRSVVIQRRVEDLQLGVESYQKKLNLIKPDTYRSDLKRKEAYTAYSNPRGFIYQNKDKKNRLMHIDELHKFSDGTLNDVRTALDDRLKGIWMKYLPQTIWRQNDRDKAGAMIQAIDKQLKTRRIMRSLEKFVDKMDSMHSTLSMYYDYDAHVKGELLVMMKNSQSVNLLIFISNTLIELFNDFGFDCDGIPERPTMYLNLWSYKVVRYRYSNPMIQPEPEGSTQGYPLDSVEVLRDYKHFYRLSHSELVDIEKVAVCSSLRSLKLKCTIESRAKKRFYTTAGNPVKEILLKLNLPDHRILKNGGEDLFGIDIPVRVSSAHSAGLPDNERIPCRIWDVAG
ncbi:hypothetical protein Tco_1284679 [Tanacetum coccineum]